jgi:hypothetical protein
MIQPITATQNQKNGIGTPGQGIDSAFKDLWVAIRRGTTRSCVYAA